MRAYVRVLARKTELREDREVRTEPTDVRGCRHDLRTDRCPDLPMCAALGRARDAYAR